MSNVPTLNSETAKKIIMGLIKRHSELSNAFWEAHNLLRDNSPESHKAADDRILEGLQDMQEFTDLLATLGLRNGYQLVRQALDDMRQDMNQLSDGDDE